MAARRRARRITLQVLGAAEDKGHVRLADFIRQLEVFKHALKQTERVLTGGDESAVYWRIVNLRHESPATVVLEEVHTKARDVAVDVPVADQFVKAIRQINQSATLPPEGDGRDLAVLESYRELASIAGRNIEKVVIRAGRNQVSLNERFRQNIDKIIGPDEDAEGSINGVLEAINLHNTLRFNIYPLVGPRKVTCGFDASMKPRVIAALDKYVSVSGTLRYKQWAPFPHHIQVRNIEIHPDHASSLEELRGIAPDATGKLTSEEFIEAIRDADW